MNVSRSGILAAWGTAYLQGAVSLDDAIEHVIGDGTSEVIGPVQLPAASDFSLDRPAPRPANDVLSLLPVDEDSRQLSWLLTDLATRKVDRIEVVFPAAGDLAGLPSGPVSINALSVGEAAVIHDAGLVLVPSVDDPHHTDWTPYAATAREIYLSPADAHQELTEELSRATDLLVALDVPSWNPAYGRISSEALHNAESDRLPAYFPRRATVILHRAAQLEAVLSVAAQDATGGAINSHEARARAAALMPLHRAVRRAFAAAYNSAPHDR